MLKTMSIEKIICTYRYLSWGLTSLIYLTAPPYHVMHYKLGVIVILLIFSIFINSIYIKCNENKSPIRKLVIAETLGIELLLLPTGGLTSPFIWYALNPILVSAIYLSSYFSWINLIFYLSTGSLMTYLIFNPDNINIFQIIFNNLNLVLVFILINFAIQALSILTNELKKSNEIKEQSIEHIMSLYQMIETLNNHSSKDKLFEVFASYTEKLTKGKVVIFWILENNLFKSNVEFSHLEIESVLNKLKSLDLKKDVSSVELMDSNFVLLPITSTSSYYGLFAVQLEGQELKQHIRLLKFISELCAVILERFEQEGIEEHLLLLEEQNRIADEMHDSVSQRLFSISYGIYGILGRLENLRIDEVKEYLNEIYQSSDLAMKELRKSIYKLSSRKNGDKYLQNIISTFLGSISKLQDINIKFDINGDEALLSLELKKGLIRIIKEACGNAVRHGMCRNLNIKLFIINDKVELIVEDDGQGFNINEVKVEGKSGLGLSNMKNITHSFHGIIDIKSKLDEGTKLIIIIPTKINVKVNYKEEENLAV